MFCIVVDDNELNTVEVLDKLNLKNQLVISPKALSTTF